MTESFKPIVTYEKPLALFNNAGDFEKVYSCPQCKRRLAFGQMTCKCGHPIVWEGIAEWDRILALFNNAGDFEKVYSCPQCKRRLAFGQMTCKCGHPIVWEGIAEWDRIYKKRKGKRK